MIKQIHEYPTPKFSEDEHEGRTLFIADIFVIV